MKPLTLITIFLLIACQSYPRPIKTVSISPDAEFQLVSPTNFDALSALQKISVFWEGHKLSFNVQLENSNGAFHLVGLTPVYSRSFLISYSKGILDFKEHPYFRYPVNPENMLADFQMAFAESQYLVNGSLKLKTSERKREFHSKSKLVQTIKYSKEDKWQSEVNIINHVKGYRLKIKTLQFEKL